MSHIIQLVSVAPSLSSLSLSGRLALSRSRFLSLKTTEQVACSQLAVAMVTRHSSSLLPKKKKKNERRRVEYGGEEEDGDEEKMQFKGKTEWEEEEDGRRQNERIMNEG